MFSAKGGADVVRIKGFWQFPRAHYLLVPYLRTLQFLQLVPFPGVLCPTCYLQFLRWNHTHSFCRTFLWRRIAQRGSSILHRSGVTILKVQSITKSVSMISLPRCPLQRICVCGRRLTAGQIRGRRGPRRFGPPCYHAATAVATKPPQCFRGHATSAALLPPPPRCRYLCLA